MALAVAVALLAGCQVAQPSPSPVASPAAVAATPRSTSSVATFAATDCPDGVTVVIVVVPTCGYLTVPERRDRSDGPMISIFVVRIEPPDGVEAGDPMVVVGESLGGQLEYGGLAPMAQRTGRVIYLVDRRGTGFSEPNLGCREIEAAGQAARGHATRDEANRPIIEAIRACRERLVGSGIDPSAYDLEASALDIEDLRVALGLEPWNVIAFGSASRLALEVGRVAPDGVRTIVLDSPVLPQGPDTMFNAAAARSALEELEASCEAEPACRDAYPDVVRLIETTVAQLDREPLTATIAEPTTGAAETVVVDGTRLARALRSILASNGGRDIGQLLPSVRSAADGALGPDDPVLRRLGRDDGLCLGYVPECAAIVHGSLLTTICRDVIPFVDRDAVLAAGAGVPGMGGLFAANPYFDACAAWGVPPAPSRMTDPVSTELPILAMVGQFDPYTGPTEALATGLGAATVVEIPGQSYNVFGFNECPRLVRRGWLDDPGAPLETACFESMPGVRPLVDTVSP
jgi:pimeloyl-ACP methyl ester carboxylesterase